MALLRSSALALLGAVAICPWAARAGDKIEFSAPGGSMTVPQVEQADKDSKRDAEVGPPPINSKILDAGETPYVVVVVNPLKHKDSRDSDSTYSSSDGRDDDADADGDTDADGDADSYHRNDSRRVANPDSSSAFSPKKDEDYADGQSLRSRLEAENSERTSGYGSDERFGRTYSDSGQESPWSRDSYNRGVPQEQSMAQRLSTFSYNIFHQGLPGLDQVSARAMSSYDTMKGINQQIAVQHQQGGMDGSQPSYGPPAAANTLEPYNSSQYGDLRRRQEQDAAGGPLTIVPGEYSSVSLNPDTFVRSESFTSQRREAKPEPPAILTFPKRPGDLLR